MDAARLLINLSDSVQRESLAREFAALFPFSLLFVIIYFVYMYLCMTFIAAFGENT